MRPQFPGMDPWLEHPALWTDGHSRLIRSMADELAPRLAPRFFVGVETRTTYVTDLDINRIYQPDVAIHSGQRGGEPRGSVVAVLDPPEVKPAQAVISVCEEVEETLIAVQELPARKLVAVIEVLSPTNKKTADGRKEYLKKRDDLIKSRIILVEIDLLRGGAPTPVKAPPPQTDYRIVICRAKRAKSAELFAFSWRTPVPPINIPLLAGDPEPVLDLISVLHALIERARYDLVIDYQQPPQPPLRPEDESWAAALIARATDQAPELTSRKETNS
jgi:Protein of unknown function (DUF4058)